ncbi:hypothetical protein JXA88_11100 [Candidatus Fermentibacteria bacterium]|nr:hypothetical protein [Candidatus Fermentibacteria bacterium]
MRCLMSVASLLVVWSTAGHARAESDWMIQYVDSPRWFADLTSRSLAVASDGCARIAYGGDHLYYAWEDEEGWHYETADPSPAVGRYAAVALDGEDRPHIAYHDELRGALKHAWYDGVWHVETVDDEGRAGWWCCIALDGAGSPHISYQADYTLRYARLEGSGWVIETVADSGSVGSYTGIAVDASGYPHISHYGNGSLHYVWRDGSGWHAEVVESGGWVGLYTSLALDSSGRPHISYGGGESWDLKYAWRGSDGWHIEVVDEEGGRGCSLVVDGEDNPRVGYVWGNRARYAWKSAGGWVSEIVNWMSPDWMTASLALGAGERPHLIYSHRLYSSGTYFSSIERARLGSSGWEIDAVDVRRRVGVSAAIALDDGGSPRIAYGSSDSLRYARYEEEGWHTCSVAYGSSAYGDVRLKISLALDEAGLPHITHWGDDRLRYVWKNAAGWQEEAVGDPGRGWYTSLKLDGQGEPCVSFYDYSKQDLQYARREGGTWIIQTVDSLGYVGGYTSLELDEGERPHIAYYDYTNERLKYAWGSGGEWRIEVVDDEGDVGSHCALALNGRGEACISYYDRARGDLKYAWRSGGGWRVARVDTLGDVGMHSSVAVDGDCGVHIAYHDASCLDLKYAYLEGGVGVEEGVQSVEVLRIDLVGRMPAVGEARMVVRAPREDAVTVAAYDLVGRRVRGVAEGRVGGSGLHPLKWDCRDDGGARVAGGVYVCTARAGSASSSVRLVVMR